MRRNDRRGSRPQLGRRYVYPELLAEHHRQILAATVFRHGDLPVATLGQCPAHEGKAAAMRAHIDDAPPGELGIRAGGAVEIERIEVSLRHREVPERNRSGTCAVVAMADQIPPGPVAPLDGISLSQQGPRSSQRDETGRLRTTDPYVAVVHCAIDLDQRGAMKHHVRMVGAVKDAAGDGPRPVSAFREQTVEQLVDLEAVPAAMAEDDLREHGIHRCVRDLPHVVAVQILEGDGALMREDQGVGVSEIRLGGTGHPDAIQICIGIEAPVLVRLLPTG